MCRPQKAKLKITSVDIPKIGKMLARSQSSKFSNSLVEKWISLYKS